MNEQKVRRSSRMLIAVTLMAIGCASQARANETILATVPFDFIVGDSRLPAGDYDVTNIAEHGVVLIASADRRHSAFVLTSPVRSDKMPAQPALLFKRFAGQHFLARVVLDDNQGREIALTTSIMERELVAVALNP